MKKLILYIILLVGISLYIIFGNPENNLRKTVVSEEALDYVSNLDFKDILLDEQIEDIYTYQLVYVKTFKTKSYEKNDSRIYHYRSFYDQSIYNNEKPNLDNDVESKAFLFLDTDLNFNIMINYKFENNKLNLNPLLDVNTSNRYNIYYQKQGNVYEKQGLDYITNEDRRYNIETHEYVIAKSNTFIKDNINRSYSKGYFWFKTILKENHQSNYLEFEYNIIEPFSQIRVVDNIGFNKFREHLKYYIPRSYHVTYEKENK